jgi:hypothetical protein
MHRRVSLLRCAGLVTVGRDADALLADRVVRNKRGLTLVENQFRFGVFLRPDPRTCAAVTQITGGSTDDLGARPRRHVGRQPAWSYRWLADPASVSCCGVAAFGKTWAGGSLIFDRSLRM